MPDVLIPLFLFMAAALLLGGVWAVLQANRRGGGRTGPLPGPPPAQSQMERQLLGMLRGDRAVMERLIAGQARRRGRASRTELVERVILELERDRR